jgi:hypothetical protein
MQPAALPALNDPALGTDWTTTEHEPRTTPRLPFPAPPIIGLPAGCLKDASGAAPGGRNAAKLEVVED